jgi:F0F1-type ATP synthase membrane subunit b/b'
MRQSALDKLQEEQNRLLASRQEELGKKFEEFKKSLVDERETLMSKLLAEMPQLKEGIKAKFAQI